MAMIGLERLVACIIGVVDGGDDAGASQCKRDFVGGAGDGNALLVDDCRRTNATSFQSGESFSQFEVEQNLRGFAGGLEFILRDDRVAIFRDRLNLAGGKIDLPCAPARHFLAWFLNRAIGR